MDTSKTLQELDGQNWGEPGYDSHLVTECHRLRRVPLRDFTIEDLRIMIGQDFGSEHLVPMALRHLVADPFAEGDFYPGDLLAATIRLPRRFWFEHPRLHAEVAAVVATALALLEDGGESPGPYVRSFIEDALRQFIGKS